MKQPRIGIYGGAFDPIHAGHLAVAETALLAGDFDEVWFVPTDTPPHKTSATSARHRACMTQLAIMSRPRFKLNTIEFDLPKPSYSLRTVRVLQGQYPDLEFTLIIGLDEALALHMWHNFRELLRIVPIMIIGRSTYDWQELDSNPVLLPFIKQLSRRVHLESSVSSTTIRAQLVRGELAIDVPRNVQDYICQHGLYS